MKSIAIVSAVFLTAFIALPAAASGGACPTDSSPDVDLAGLAYVHTASGGDHNGETFFYVDTNGLEGLQYGAAHPVFGWSEMDGISSPCKDGDLLVL